MRQDPIYLSPPHVGERERELLLEAFDSNWVAPVGPHITAFESELAGRVGVGHAAALTSGTAGLHLALRLLGVGPRDDVLVSDLTFAAPANAVVYVGARPVFVDADAGTWQVDPGLLADELVRRNATGRLPAAVIVVDLYGQCADYDRIRSVCDAYAVPLIEDAAEALGATYRGRAAGALGAVGVFSFNGNKIVTTGGGGMLVSDRADWVARARFLATQARDDAPHYQHSEVGHNYRLSNLLAAVGRGQLANLGERIAARRRINATYRDALGEVPGVAFMPEACYGQSNCWLTCITVDPLSFGANRDDILHHLQAQEIEARPVWKPMHLQPVFQGCAVAGGSVADDLFARGLCLPSGSSLTEAQQERVIAAVRECYGRSASPGKAASGPR